MRVLLVSTGVVTIPPQTGGAVESYVWDIAQILHGAGVNVTVVSNFHRKLIECRNAGIEFVPTASPIDRFPLRPEVSAVAHLAGGLAAAASVRVYLSRGGSNHDRSSLVVHLNEEISALAVTRVARRGPKVLTIHNPPMALAPSDIGPSERMFRNAGSLLTLRFTLPYVDRVIALSTPMAEFLQSDWNVSPEKVTVLPLPVDTQLFAPPIVGDPVRKGLLFVGRLEGRKNPAALVRCIATCPPGDTLTIVGKGPLESALKSEARRHGVADRIRIVSELTLPELIRLYQTSRALILPSSLEVYPRVVIEAAACGLPVVLPRSEIYQDFISAGFVATYVPGDSVSMLEAVLATMQGGSRWEEMSTAGRTFALDNLGYQVYARRLVEIYRGVGG
jgi:glycosyltransferase involved in cell wall biosynthesis